MSSAAPTATSRLARPNGWWGVAVFVATEATLFGTIFGTYFYLRFGTDRWPPAGVAEPAVAVPLILTAVLVATSLPMQLAQAVARRGRLGATRFLLLLALVVQAGYFAMQISRFVDSLDRFAPQGNAYASIYYTLLGAHHAHVVVGLLLSLWLLVRLARGLTHYRVVALRAIALYWYAVAAIGALVVATQVSPS